MIDDDELDARLAQAPTSASPPRDPWPEVARRTVDARPLGGRPQRTVVVAAAAAAIFALGVAAGFMADRRPQGAEGAAHTGGAGVSPQLMAAARVQATGSAYVAAVGALERVSASVAAGPDDVAVSQGYEAALAAIEAVTETMAARSGATADAAELSGAASRARRALGDQVSRLLSARSFE